MDPDKTALLGAVPDCFHKSSLVRVQSVCFIDKKQKSGVHMNICCRHSKQTANTRVKVFRIIPEFEILRLTFHSVDP